MTRRQSPVQAHPPQDSRLARAGCHFRAAAIGRGHHEGSDVTRRGGWRLAACGGTDAARIAEIACLGEASDAAFMSPGPAPRRRVARHRASGSLPGCTAASPYPPTSCCDQQDHGIRGSGPTREIGAAPARHSIRLCHCRYPRMSLAWRLARIMGFAAGSVCSPFTSPTDRSTHTGPRRAHSRNR
jgi:hypothetical protein